MYARWASFSVGLALVLAPLVLGYGALGPILHDVALGLLVCILALATVEWPGAAFVLLGAAGWLVLAGHAARDARPAAAALAAGVLVLLAAPFARARRSIAI